MERPVWPRLGSAEPSSSPPCTHSLFILTQIIGTIGPASWNRETLLELIDSGLNVVRLNFSHGSHEVRSPTSDFGLSFLHACTMTSFSSPQRHAETVALVREVADERPGCNIAIMLDTKGPEIRTGMLKDHADVELVAGQDLFLSTDYSIEGDNTRLGCSYGALSRTVEPGQSILVADGSLVLKVKECHDECVGVGVGGRVPFLLIHDYTASWLSVCLVFAAACWWR